ncbi:MAG: glycosyltransferase family 4 protein [Pseudanabaenales cyanobacterium]|nr:glycosyltransferase family 4 protein [Pseudanabaenales cyanobacterium]
MDHTVVNRSAIRTLFITRNLPYPPRGGAPLRNWQNINAMALFGPVGVFTLFRGKPNDQTLPGVELWHHYNTVEQPRSRFEKLRRRLWWLRPHGHPLIDWLYVQVAAQQLDEILKQFQPNLVIFEEMWLYRYLPLVKRYGCSIILDNHNVEALRNTPVATHHPITQLRHFWGQIHIKTTERDFIRQVDQIWACSDQDIQWLQTLYRPKSHTCTIPNTVDVAQYNQVRSAHNTPSPEQAVPRHTLLFLGQFAYSPNAVAAELLINQIYPQLQTSYPNCRLLLVGTSPTPFMQAAANRNPNIVVTGEVPDVRPYLAAADVMVVPLRQGSGTRLKILEAFAAGCPVVSTAKGVEGLKAIDGEHLLIRETVEAIAQGVIQLWSDPKQAQLLADAAFKLVQEQYSWRISSQQIGQAVQQLFG